jgi:hypothetical protein
MDGVSRPYYTSVLGGSYIDSVGTARYVMLFSRGPLSSQANVRVHSIQRQMQDPPGQARAHGSKSIIVGSCERRCAKRRLDLILC